MVHWLLATDLELGTVKGCHPLIADQGATAPPDSGTNACTESMENQHGHPRTDDREEFIEDLANIPISSMDALIRACALAHGMQWPIFMRDGASIITSIHWPI